MSIFQPIPRVSSAQRNRPSSALMTALGLAALFLVVFDHRIASAQPVHVQSTKGGGTGLGSLSVSFGALPAVDRLIVVAASTWDPNAGEGDLPAGTVTDNQGNTYTRATLAVTPGGLVRVAIFYTVVVTSAGTFTVTVNPSGAGAEMDVAIHEYSGNVTTGVLDVAASTNGTSTTPNSGPVTTTAPLTLVFGAMTEDNDNTMTPGTTFTQRQEEESNTNFQCLNTEDKTAGVVGTHSADWTLSASGPWAGAVAAFKFYTPNPGGFGGRSFVKSTAVGNQAVAHGLGEVPKAIIFWVSADTAGLPFTNYYTSIGFTDGTAAGSFSAAAAALNNQDFSNASRRMANKAITIVLWGEALMAEANLASWDATSFTLNWTTNDATPARVHFIAIGGSGVSAKVVNWQAPTSTVDKDVLGVGFEPDVVLHGYSGSAFTASPVPGNSIASAHIGMGAMTRAGDQWANMIRTIDNVDTTESNRGQQTDAAVYMFGAGVSVLKKASFVSMLPDGFRVNFSVTDPAATQIFSLALKGVSGRAGNFAKVTAGVPQAVADVGFRPEVVLLTSIQEVAQAAPVAHARMGIGASDGTVEGSTAVQDTSGLVDPTTTSADQYDKGDKVFIKVDNNTPTVTAEAELSGFFNGGFNLNWTTNDAVATQILYLALGPKSEAKVLSGSYTGNGTDNRAINVGFVPDFVILKSAGATTGVFRSSTMIGDNAKPSTGTTALTPNLIQSFDTANAGGFTVGTDASVNTNGTMYYWVAFQAGPGKMKVGTYTGTGTGTPPPVSGLGFSPELVYVMSEGADYAVHRSAALPDTLDFEFSAGDPTWIDTLDTDGFTVGSTDAKVNQSGVVYHYVAWNEDAGYMDVGSYVGNGLDNQNQPTGFAPEYVTVMRAGSDAVHRPASLDQGVDSTLYFRAAASGTLRIKALLTDGFRRGTTGNVNASGLTYAFYAWKRSSQPLIQTGDYTGNGLDNQATLADRIGFVPDVVIVKTSAQIAVIRTSTMVGDLAKPMVGATALTANLIQSLDTANAGGFTVGTNAMVNSNTVAYYFIAFKAGAGTMKVGTYVGNGSAIARQITGVGFSPELIFVMATSGAEAVHRSAASAETYNFSNSAGASMITSLDVDGFTLTSANASVNTTGITYHYIAWNEIPGEMDIAAYSGTGADNRNLTGLGFEPEYVMARNIDAQRMVHHPASLGRSVDSSLHFDATINAANLIQTLQPDGFQVGTSASVNSAGANNYVYYAWKRPEVRALTAVRLISFDAGRQPSGRTLVRWRTGWEVDNLGFNVYREQDGGRTRLTPSLIAGSGLVLGPGTASNQERSYTWWDNGPSAPGAMYWLQDMNLNGTSTWHGPVSPGGAASLEAAAVDSPLLRELARRRASDGGRTAGSRAGVPDASDTLWAQAVEGAGREGNGGRVQALDSAVTSAVVSPALARQQELAAGPAVKIAVRSAGWYRVGQPELVAAGLDPAVDPRTLQLYLEGMEVAAIVRGEADGRFDAGDALEFYGAGVDTPYTDTRIYWLHAGAQSGLRAAVLDRSTSPAAEPASFPFTVERRDRTIFFAALLNGDADNFFGELVVAGEETPQVLATPHVDAAAGAASLEVTLQGVTDAPGASDHRVAVRLNGTEVGEIVFEGRSQAVGTFTVPHSMLLDGENTVTLEARGSEADTSLVERVRLTYQHTFEAEAGALAFTAAADAVVTVRGLDAGAVRAFDLSDPRAPIELRGFESTEGGLQAVTLRVPGSGPRRLLALSDAGLLTPVSVRANQPSAWNRSGQDGTHVIIGHRDFLASLSPLKALREGQGHAGALIDVEDLYDEFSFGEKTPHALKDFLIAAKSVWRRSPQYVVLAGNATSDPRDYYGLGEPDFVPTKIVPTASLETASDDWFADVDGDGLPELAAVGRLPVRTAAEAAAVVAKIVDYEQSGDAPWSKHVLLLADQNDPDGNFEDSSMQVAGRLPSDYTAAHIFRRNSASDARAELLQRINEGQLLVNFVGHGSVDAWGKLADLLTPLDITDSWANQSRLPFVVAMNCLNGFFQGLFPEESLAETLVRAPDRGAVAVWASSALTESRTQVRMNRELFTLLLAGRARTIGEAAVAAKASVIDMDVRRSWILFGDPAMGLKGRPVDALTVPTMSLDRVALAFAATNTAGTLTNKTSGQPLTVTFTGVSGAAWTATADQPWVQVTGGSGAGAGQFTVDVVSASGLPASGIVSATLTVVSADAVNSPRTVSISLSLHGTAATQVPFGFFDTPVTGSTGVTGSMAVSGWALDDVGISVVRVYRNCLDGIDAPANCQNLDGHNVALIGDATFVAGARPDVEAAYPDYPANFRGGWGLLVLTNMLPRAVAYSGPGGGQGPVTLYAFATDVEGYSVLLGTKTVTLDNDNASAPFGTIDTPGQGGTVSGIAVNFGWALTPGTAMIPTDGSTMRVVVDGVAIGTVNYNYCRGTSGSSPAAGQCDDDVAQLFPGATNIANASGAQGYFVLDTTIFANGRHTIAWGVSDGAGRLAGIGSRFFTVLNDGSSSVVARARTAAALSDAPARVMGAAAALAWRSTVFEGVSARTGFDFGAPFDDIAPDDAGLRHVTIPELGRLELQFGGSIERGYLRANGSLRALPPGSRLDPANGVFTWAPGPAYVGLYELVFLQGAAQIRVQVTIETSQSPGPLMRGHIDLPSTGRAVSGNFTVAGWALDERAWQGSGVDAVHVWAQRRDVPGSAAVFIGAAEVAGLRPDVAAVFGPRFNRAGWGLSASGLAPGTYDVTAFFWSRRAASFADARTVSVIVR